MSSENEVLIGVVRLAKEGNEEAIAGLYDIYAQRIYRYIFYHIDCHEQDAQDLTSDVFIRMVKGLPNYEERGLPFEAWLFQIASSRFIDYIRSKKRKRHVELNENLRDDDDSPEEILLNEEQLEQLMAVFHTLDEEQKSVLQLRFVERKSHKETAKLLNRTESAVKTIQHRALQQLAKLLNKGSKKTRHYLRGSKTNDEA